MVPVVVDSYTDPAAVSGSYAARDLRYVHEIDRLPW
jgi:hypothetical protein